MFTYRAAYCYPSSTTSERFGRGLTGCYYVEKDFGWAKKAEVQLSQGAFKTREEADACAQKLNASVGLAYPA